jgi:S1-C subfamily serine protease
VLVQQLGRFAAVAVLASASWGAGCMETQGRHPVATTFATDFDCQEHLVIREVETSGRYLVMGCGKRVVYQCVKSDRLCAIQTVKETEDRSLTRESGHDAQRAAPLAAEPHMESKGNQAVLTLELPLDARSSLRIAGAPKQHPDLVQLKLLRQNRSEDVDECNLTVMLNGQLMDLPKSTADVDGKTISHRVQISGDTIGELGAAEKVSLRVCDERWALSGMQLERVHEFVDRFQEEIALTRGARSGNAANMLPPSGGWPSWSVSGDVPASAKGDALEPTALFKKLSSSVFQLEASREHGTAQGSAVAISSAELLTNCHVVQGALKLTLKQSKKTWPAHVVRADPATDRCIISATGVALQPVMGVRSYDSLQVGETAYTLGSPVGLELTLSNGIVSGRRDEQGQHYVQTTAPISPGSSGGGLFDARGNLIGITTLALVGREHLNQSLNFAIPADAFWQP